MIKRYCDRCGQQIDEGVHAWYVLELHGTDGEFRHKELCEECYEYLCEKDEAPKADRKTEPIIYGNEHNCMMTVFGECSYAETGCGDCAVVEKVRNALDKYEPKDEPQTDCDGCQHYADEYTADACYECKRSYKDCYEPQTERSSE